MTPVTIIVIASWAGILTKVADLTTEHGLNLPKFICYGVGILYGVFVGYLASAAGPLGQIWMGALIGVFVAGKIDHNTHKTGLFSAIMVLVMRGIEIPTIYTVIAIGMAFLDERVSDWVDRGIPRAYIEKFFFLEGFCLVVSILTGNYMISVSVFTFDLLYFYTTKWFIVSRVSGS